MNEYFLYININTAQKKLSGIGEVRECIFYDATNSTYVRMRIIKEMGCKILIKKIREKSVLLYKYILCNIFGFCKKNIYLKRSISVMINLRNFCYKI